MSATPADEFDALRTIVKTLEAFGADDQNRILRWTAEKLGLSQTQHVPPQTGSTVANISPPTPPPPSPSAAAKSIKSFVEQKKPKNDMQFAAVVAYFYRFEATDVKESITKADLLDACRLSNYTRPPAPGQTLRNAVNAGLLDKADRGAFAINSVGENLVAVTLPGDGTGSGDLVPRKRARRNRGRPTKKATLKNANNK